MSFMTMPNEPPVLLDTDGRSDYPPFTRISIETLSFCNRACSFCPLAWSQNERGRKRMTNELYASIVDQLRELRFAGVAQMFLLSEPTIDVSMKKKLTMLREACPDATTYISSNGDTFDHLMKYRGIDHALKAIEEYYEAGLNVLNLNIYDEGDEQAERFGTLVAAAHEQLHVKPTSNKYRRHNPRGRYVTLTDMRVESQDVATKTNVLYIKTKAERQTIVAPAKYCARPHRQIVIEWDGNVPICCAIDVTDKSLPSMGDANTQSLVDIWNGEPMNRYRWFLQQKRRELPGCSTCTHQMAFPHIVRKVAASEDLVERWGRP